MAVISIQGVVEGAMDDLTFWQGLSAEFRALPGEGRRFRGTLDVTNLQDLLAEKSAELLALKAEPLSRANPGRPVPLRPSAAVR